jgi:hypothetical protein
METDDEMSKIDSMEDRIAPIDPDATRVRELISSLELCHHKAAQWIDNIVEAIGAGKTDKGLGTRSPAERHAAETVWQEACAALSAWCAGRPSASIDSSIHTIPAFQLLALLGERSPLKEWQAQRVIDKIRSLIHWPRPEDDPAAQYHWILLSGGEYESFYRSECPEYFKEHEDYWLQTVRTIIHDTENGDPAELSLGLAIDMLWPCHLRFVENLQIVLAAIGGNLNPEKPYAACGRNIHLVPSREKMERVSKTLSAFCSDAPGDANVDSKILALLGEPTETKKWLAASLDKTIRLQLNPPDALRAISAMAGPDWIRD